jgi:uncharacterized membrane protein (UPF0127 family)
MSTEDNNKNNPAELPLRAINISKDGIILAEKVEWAGTSAERRHGLLGRSSLGPEEGMYIAPTQWLHTFRMKFEIDIAFMDRNGRVLSIHHALKPNRLSKISLRAEGALELSAGRLRATNTEVGDIIKFQEIKSNEQ